MENKKTYYSLLIRNRNAWAACLSYIIVKRADLLFIYFSMRCRMIGHKINKSLFVILIRALSFIAPHSTFNDRKLILCNKLLKKLIRGTRHVSCSCSSYFEMCIRDRLYAQLLSRYFSLFILN